MERESMSKSGNRSTIVKDEIGFLGVNYKTYIYSVLKRKSTIIM